MIGQKIQPSTATSTTVDAKLHKSNVQNTKQKPEKLQDIVKTTLNLT